MHLAGGVAVAAHAVEVAQQSAAVAHLLERHACGQRKVRDTERPGVRRVGLRLERFVRHAKVRRAGAGHHPRDHHVGRQLWRQMAKLARNNRAAARVNVLIRVGAGVVAGEANLVAGGMPGVVVMEAADDGPLVHDAGGARQHVGEQDAGDARADDAELAAVFHRSFGLGVPHVDVAGSAAHPEDDGRGAARADISAGIAAGLMAKQVAQGQPGGPQDARFDEAAPGAHVTPEFVTA
jgi:hypothetical protein